ncbi:hypothetical protein TNCV_2794451 [Trichonephila clavipes]|nr:hypothetical protein TNCV_2794451 [Trichonephila clavipes]
MSDIGPFPGYFLGDKQYHSRARSVGVYNPMTDWTYSHLRMVRMLSPVQSNCDAHDTIANGQLIIGLHRSEEQNCGIEESMRQVGK